MNIDLRDLALECPIHVRKIEYIKISKYSNVACYECSKSYHHIRLNVILDLLD